ncbi:MAG: ester cyclase [Gemmatimonadota bacterium]|nr:MAG: ester cyclase [Gemmatimonadota bacterium]
MRTFVTFFCIPAVLMLAGCTPPPDPTLEANKELFRQYVEAYNATDIDRFDELMTAEFARHSDAVPDVNSLEEFKAELAQGFEAFPDGQMEVHMLVAEGDKVAGYMTFVGTQQGAWGPFPATGEQAELKFIYLFRVQEGKLAEMWVEFDNIVFLTQLGHFPPPEGT